MKIAVTGASGLIGTPLVSSLQTVATTSYGSYGVIRRLSTRSSGTRQPAQSILRASLGQTSCFILQAPGSVIGDGPSRTSRRSSIAVSSARDCLLEHLPNWIQNHLSWCRPQRSAGTATEETRSSTRRRPQGTGFLADVVAAWEAAAQPVSNAGIRVVHPRTGIVLSKEGGVIRRLLLPFKLGAGGRTGPGSQWWSWIALDDGVRALTRLAFSSWLAGPVNLTAPNPVTNQEFVDTLGSVLRRPTVLPTPSLALKAILGAELAEALLFQSQRIVPARLLEDGFNSILRTSTKRCSRRSTESAPRRRPGATATVDSMVIELVGHVRAVCVGAVGD